MALFMKTMNIQNILNDKIPSYLKPYLESEAMQRLKKVNMNCGVNETSLPLYQNSQDYTRFVHSLNVALILDHFTNDPKQVLAGLFHDISTPAFSHTFDFMNHDYLKQESYENLNEHFIQNDGSIVNLLEKDNISLKEVSDYKIYSLADNESPRLSSDRLEYTLSNSLNYGFTTIDIVKQIYDDITIVKNESNILELAFKTPTIAIDFCMLSLKCGKVYSSKESRYAMEILARTLKRSLNDNILTNKDMYLGDKELLVKLNDSIYKDDIFNFMNLYQVCNYTEFQPNSIIVDAKKRYIDPLIINTGRCSEYSDIIKDEIQSFLSIDFTEEYLKGDSYGK